MLRVGAVTHDGFIDPQPPVKRAIAWVKEVPSSDTNRYIVDMIDFTIHGTSDAWFSIKKMYWPDGVKVTKDGILSGGEPIHPHTDLIYQDQESPGMSTAAAMAMLRQKRDEIRNAFAKSWKKLDVDVMIAPAFIGPACLHDTALE